MADENVQQKKGSNKIVKLLIILIILVILGAAAFFGLQMFVFKDDDEATKTEEVVEEETTVDPKEFRPKGIIVTMPTFVVNLADPLGKRFLKMSIDVEVRDEAVKLQLETESSRIKDTIIMLLSSKTFADISTFEKKIELKQELTKRMTQILGINSVLHLYITDMVVQ